MLLLDHDIISIIIQYKKKIKEKIKVLNTFENIMENRAFALWSKCSIFRTISKIHSIKGDIMEERVKRFRQTSQSHQSFHNLHT